MPTCLVVQHVAAEGPYAIGEALERGEIALDVRMPLEGDRLPDDLAGFCAVVVMGGPMSAAGDEGFGPRGQELDLLRGALARRIPVLGVCLGAQLLAAAGGGAVYRGPAGAEIGWSAVTFAPAAASDPLLGGLGSSLEVLHWHGDTFDLPPAAVLLASSGRYAHQAFRIGAHAWGLQFHVEVDHGAVEAFLAMAGSEAAAVGVDPAEIAAAAPAALERLAPVRELVCARFAAVVRDHASGETPAPFGSS